MLWIFHLFFPLMLQRKHWIVWGTGMWSRSWSIKVREHTPSHACTLYAHTHTHVQTHTLIRQKDRNGELEVLMALHLISRGEEEDEAWRRRGRGKVHREREIGSNHWPTSSPLTCDVTSSAFNPNTTKVLCHSLCSPIWLTEISASSGCTTISADTQEYRACLCTAELLLTPPALRKTHGLGYERLVLIHLLSYAQIISGVLSIQLYTTDKQHLLRQNLMHTNAS